MDKLRKLTLKKIAIFIGILLATVGAIIIILHGRIEVVNFDQVQSVAYAPVHNLANVESTDKSSFFAPAGTYTLQVTMKDNTSYITQVDVPMFLGKVTVTPESQQRPVVKTGANALDYVMPYGSSLLSYEAGGSFLRINTDDAFGDNNTFLKEFEPNFTSAHSMTPVGDERLAYIEGPAGEEGYRLTLFTPATNRYAALDDTISDIDAPIIRTTDGFAILEKGDQTISYFELQDGQARKTGSKSLSSIKPATAYGVPMFAASNNRYAFVEGGDYLPPSDLPSEEAGAKEQHVTITDHDLTAITTIKPEAKGSIRAVSLSPDGEKLLINAGTNLRIYRLEDGQQIFTSPLEMSDVWWLDNDRLVAKTTLEGIYLFSLSTNSASSIFNESLINITALSGIFDGKLYFTGFAAHDTEQLNPNAYYIDLDQPLRDDNQLLKKFPYTTSRYTIDHTGRTIVIKPFVMVGSSGIPDPTSVDQAVSAARDYLQSEITQLDQYQVTTVR